MKLWAGRFSKEADERVNDFNSSIRFDSRMYAHDIKGSMAHAQMLGAQGTRSAMVLTAFAAICKAARCCSIRRPRISICLLSRN